MPLSELRLRELLTEYKKENWQGIQTPEAQQRSVEKYVLSNGEGFFEAKSDYFVLHPRAMILDVGCGVGSFVVGCRERGYLAFGIEPDRIGRGGRLTAVEIAQQRLDSSAFSVAIGEQLPFKDKAFDLVTLHQVLEHVVDQREVLHECLRVVKDDGVVYFSCPNYLRFWEPHYKVWLFPLMPKPLARWYLRLRGRNPVMLDQLTYTTHRFFDSLLKTLGSEYDVVDMHRESFINKLGRQGSFQSLRGKLIGALSQLPILGELVMRASLVYFRFRNPVIEYVISRHRRN